MQPKLKAPIATDSRRIQMADAAVSIIAREGARGLTHRAIDAKLGVPEGTTSYYFRTRMMLLAAVSERLVTLDISDMQWASELSAPKAGPLDVARFAKLQSETYIDWLSPRKRERTLARCELFLEATRNEVLAEIMGASREQFLQHLTVLFRLLKAKNPAKAAVSLIDFGMGLLYSYAIDADRPLDKLDLRALVATAIALLIKA